MGEFWPKRKQLTLSGIIKSLLWVMFFVVFTLLDKYTDRFAFIDADPFPLWYIALGAGILIGAFCAYKNALGKGPVISRIVVFILAAVLSFATLGFLFAHLNHVLDPNEPTQYTAVIAERFKKARGRRGGDSYYLTLTVNGMQMTVGVSGRHYYSVEEGACCLVAYHEGAFDEPYYEYLGVIASESETVSQ